MDLRLFAAGLLVAALLAGCSSAPEPKKADGPALEVTQSTGGIRGLVVDAAVVPVPGAKVVLSGGKNATSAKDGTFNFTGLQPGDYVLQVSKLGYISIQSQATVVAGVAEPPYVKVLLQRITSAAPYVDTYKLDGFYECGFGTQVITDSCDFGYRTAWDQVNESSGSPPPVAPRSLTGSVNTQFIDVAGDTFTVIQEAFWESSTITSMMVSLDETPIDNKCDCSDSYVSVTMGNPTYGRLDTYDAKTMKVHAPAGERAAARGFIPFGSPQVATNLKFTILTTLFHNTPAPEGWTYETKDQYPI